MSEVASGPPGGVGLGRGPQPGAVHQPPGVGEVGLRARCRDFSWSSPASPLPHPACASQRTGRSGCLARWSVMCCGGCRCRSPRGRYFAAAIAVADHGDAGCAGEYDPVPGEPPPLVTETAAEFFHPEPGPARVLGACPAHQPTPGEAVDRAEHCLGHAVTEIVRPSRQRPVQAGDQLVDVHMAGLPLRALRTPVLYSPYTPLW